MAWEIELHDEVNDWFLALCKEDPDCADEIEAAIDALTLNGPTQGRSLVDRIKGSQFHHMKELRPPSPGGSDFRILFAFDPRRRAILLVAGDKAGDWKRWYEINIPIADERYAKHLAALDEEG